MIGTWSVKVKDSTHGGSNFYQSYSLAVRGVNVNDLDPDPTFVSNSFDLSVPIPQVNEEVEFSISLINQGAGSVPELSVLAAVNSVTIDTKTLSLSPGEYAELTWNWTPNQDGENIISFYIREKNSNKITYWQSIEAKYAKKTKFYKILLSQYLSDEIKSFFYVNDVLTLSDYKKLKNNNKYPY